MKKNLCKRTLTMLLAFSTLAAFGLSACGKDDDGPGAVIDDIDYEWLDPTIADTSDLTSWEDLGQTRTLSLTAWNMWDGVKQEAENDVVYPEIRRVTGVTVDTKNSFDNGGMSFTERLAQLITYDELPDIAYGSWTDTELCYDLTELVPKYCPTIMKRMPDYIWNKTSINGGVKNKIYAVPFGLGDVGLSDVDSEAPRDKATVFNTPTDYYPYILVREDILEDAYGAENIYTTAELQDIFAKRGYFTEDELFDVEITSAEQFRTEFLPKIYDAIHADSKYQIDAGRWVEVMPAGYGGNADTWDLMGILIPQLIGATGNLLNTQHTYWDAEAQQVKVLMEQDFYQTELKEWVKLIESNKYVSKAGLTDSANVVKGDYNNARYAIGYGPSTKPDATTVRYKDGTVNYRKVYLKIEKSSHFEFFSMQEALPSSVCIFKDNVREEDLPQILRWLDYQCSRLADKLVAWGPRSAGLFTETDGVRQYKDAELVRQMVYSTETLGEKVKAYNLRNGTLDSAYPVFNFFYQGGSKDHPRCVYDLSEIPSYMNVKYSSAEVFPDIKPVGLARSPEIWKWKNSDLEGVEDVWGKRDTLETNLRLLLLGGSGNYNSGWAAVKSNMEYAGWTEEYFAGDFQDAFLNANKDFLEGFYRG